MISSPSSDPSSLPALSSSGSAGGTGEEGRGRAQRSRARGSEHREQLRISILPRTPLRPACVLTFSHLLVRSAFIVAHGGSVRVQRAVSPCVLSLCCVRVSVAGRCCVARSSSLAREWKSSVVCGCAARASGGESREPSHHCTCLCMPCSPRVGVSGRCFALLSLLCSALLCCRRSSPTGNSSEERGEQVKHNEATTRRNRKQHRAEEAQSEKRHS